MLIPQRISSEEKQDEPDTKSSELLILGSGYGSFLTAFSGCNLIFQVFFVLDEHGLSEVTVMPALLLSHLLDCTVCCHLMCHGKISGDAS